MNFSIRRIIRAFAAPRHRISCSKKLWRIVLTELERRGEGVHEAGAFLLGRASRGVLEVTDVEFYDNLDPSAYDSGACILYADAFSRLWAICRERGVSVVADVHSHPGLALQSNADRTNPMVAQKGHMAIIVPNFGRTPIRHAQLGIYEYLGGHEWKNWSGADAEQFFYVGLWS